MTDKARASTLGNLVSGITQYMYSPLWVKMSETTFSLTHAALAGAMSYQTPATRLMCALRSRRAGFPPGGYGPKPAGITTQFMTSKTHAGFRVIGQGDIIKVTTLSRLYVFICSLYLSPSAYMSSTKRYMRSPRVIRIRTLRHSTHMNYELHRVCVRRGSIRKHAKQQSRVISETEAYA